MISYGVKRRVRRVDLDWQHPWIGWGPPPDWSNGKPIVRFLPLYDPLHEKHVEWAKGDYLAEKPKNPIGFQMYEEVSEGTPISPVFDNIESLVDWLVDKRASIFADVSANRETWMAVVESSLNDPQSLYISHETNEVY